MKQLFKLIFTIALVLIFQSCDECKDQPIISENKAGVNLFDLKQGSAFFQQAVVSFQFTQVKHDYDSGCGTSTSETTLKLVNNTQKKITFDYNINCIGNNSGNLLWNYQSIATIPPGPGTSVDVGYLNSNPVILSYSSITVQSVKIQYE